MRRSLLFLMLLVSAGVIGGLELEQGDLRLTLEERSSRFTLSVRHDGRWTSLLYPEDARTSSIQVLEDNQVHRLGDSGRFSQEIEQGEFGPRFVWQSSTLVVSQTFEFIRGLESIRTNGVQIRTRVTSVAEEPRTVGVRYLLDSWLGERRNVHFVLPGSGTVDGEREVDSETPFLRSVETPDAAVGLQLMLGVTTVTPPQSVYLANWQRLSDSSWGFEHNPTRNFNRLPYSINDSAILLTYPSVRLGPGESYEVVTRLGNLAANGYVGPAVVASENVPDGEDEQTVLLARLAELINDIAALSLEGEIDMAEILRLQEELQLLGEQIRRR